MIARAALLAALFTVCHAGAASADVVESQAPASPRAFAVGVEGLVGGGGTEPFARSAGAMAGWGPYGRYRILPNFSVGGTLTLLGHSNTPCRDDICVASAGLLLATARYHRATESLFDPWIQVGVGAGISEEASAVAVAPSWHRPPLDRLPLAPAFEVGSGIDMRFGAVGFGLSGRVMAFGAPFRVFLAPGVHFEVRW